MKKILIIGGVAGCATAAAHLRRLDKTSKILMFERGNTFVSQIVSFHIISEK